MSLPSFCSPSQFCTQSINLFTLLSGPGNPCTYNSNHNRLENVTASNTETFVDDVFVTNRYTKMLRLLKRYTFGYHLSGNRHAPRVPNRSIIMSSYPGALSSHDEYYVVRGGKDDDDLVILAAIPLKDSSGTSLSAPGSSDDQDNEEQVKKHGSVC